MGSVTQEFCLRWNNHQSTVMSVMSLLLERESLVDVTLAAEGRFLKVHRLVLCACSAYFEELLSQQNDKHAIVFLKDVSFDELRSLVDYMYKGEVSVAQDQLTPFLRTAEALKIKGLADKDERGRKSGGSSHNEDDIENPLLDMDPSPSSRYSGDIANFRPDRVKVPVKRKRKPKPPASPPVEMQTIQPNIASYAAEPDMENENFVPVHEEMEHKTEPEDTDGEFAKNHMEALMDQQNEWRDPDDLAQNHSAVAEYSLDDSFGMQNQTGDSLGLEASDAKSKAKRIQNAAASKGSVFTCPLCLRGYTNQDSYRRHMRVDCGQEPRYPCLICGRRFKRSDHLKYHQKTHMKKIVKSLNSK